MPSPRPVPRPNKHKPTVAPKPENCTPIPAPRPETTLPSNNPATTNRKRLHSPSMITMLNT